MTDATPKPTPDEVDAAREAAFEGIRHWLDLATSAGQSIPEIMRDLMEMMGGGAGPQFTGIMRLFARR